jgi:hypothetical protein
VVVKGGHMGIKAPLLLSVLALFAALPQEAGAPIEFDMLSDVRFRPARKAVRRVGRLLSRTGHC